jgi:hypoxanthine phosphoribosyltransferase
MATRPTTTRVGVKKVSKKGSLKVIRGGKDIVKTCLSWGWFNLRVKEVADRLIDCKPRFVIGVSRGGLIPAVVLSHKLKIPMGSISTSSYTEYSKQNKKVDVWGLTLPLGVNSDQAKSMEFLIVDDIYDSGKTYRALVDYLKKYGIVNFRYISMIEKNRKDDSWVVFPWET